MLLQAVKMQHYRAGTAGSSQVHIKMVRFDHDLSLVEPGISLARSWFNHRNHGLTISAQCPNSRDGLMLVKVWS